MNYEMKLNKRYADAIRESDKEKFTFADFVRIASDCKLSVVSVVVYAEPGEPREHITIYKNMRNFVFDMPINASGDFNHATQSAEVIPGIENGSFQIKRHDLYNKYTMQFDVVGALIVVHSMINSIK